MSRLSLPSAAALPLELRKELSQLDLRLRWVSFVKGMGSLLFVVLLLAALFLGIDFFIPLPGPIRFVFLALLCAVVLGLGYRWLVQPLIRQRRWPELAFLIDRSFPELQERVSSTVELSMVPAEHRALASEFMTDRLRKETDRRLAGVDLWDCLSLSSMGAALAAGLITAVVAMGPLLWNSGGYTLLWQRLLTPWQNLDSATNLTFVVDEGDRVVPRGDDLVIRARPQWRYAEGTLPREIRLTWTDDSGETFSREMAYDPQQRAYVGTITQVIAPLSFHLSSRQAQSRTYQVTVADRPRIMEATLTIIPPAYTQRPETKYEGAVGVIRAIQGSRLVAELRFDHPVQNANWQWSSVHSKAASVAQSATIEGKILEDGYLARIETTAEQSDTFRFDVISAAGLHNVDEPQRMIQIISDNAPRLDMSGVEEPLKVQPNEILPIDVTAEDDFGVVDLRVVVEHLTNGKQNPLVMEWKSEKTALDARRINDSLELALDTLELKGGDILGYRAVARDARPSPGPNEVWTARRVLIIDDGVKSLAGQEVEDFYEAMQRQADLVKHEVAAHRKQVERTRSELDPQPRDIARETLLEQRPDWSQTKSSLSLQLDDLSRKLRQRPITEALSRLNVDPAQELIQQAAAALEKFDPQSSDDPLEAIREDEKSLRKAEDLMNRLVNQLRDAERIEQELTELQQLARRSRQLANQADQIARDDAPEPATEQPGSTPLDSLEQEYNALQHDLQELLKRRPELKQAARNALLSEVSEASNLAQELSEQQQSLTESLEAARQQQLANEDDAIATELAEAKRMAEDLAVQSEREAAETGESVFNADAVSRASEARQQANTGDAMQTLDQAKQELERFRQQQAEAAPLSTDLKQAATALAEKSKQLSEELSQQEQDRKEFEKRQKTANETARKSKRPIPEETQQELTDTEAELRKNEDRIAADIAGIQQAVSDLHTPPDKHWLKADTLNRLDNALDEMAKKADQADRRMKDAGDALERLAREVGTPQERAKRNQQPVQSVRDQAESLAKRLEELKEQATTDANAAKQAARDIASQPQAQAEQLMRRDVGNEEQQLADAVQAALEARKQLEAGDLEQAADAQQKFVEQLDKLKNSLQETAEAKQPADSQEGSSQRKAEQAWKNVDLPEELKKARFETRPEHQLGENQKKAEEIAQAQAELKQQADKAMQEHADDPKSPELKNKLHALADRQRQLAEQTAQQQGPEGSLPKMQATRAMREASEALREGDAEKASKTQEQAARLLHQAQQHRQAAAQAESASEESAIAEASKPENNSAEEKALAEGETTKQANSSPTNNGEGEATETPLPQDETAQAKADNTAPGSPMTPAQREDLTNALKQKLDQLQEKLAGKRASANSEQTAEANTSEASAANGSAPTESANTENASSEANPTDRMDLLEQLQALRDSQERIAEQARQMAAQTRLEEPDNNKRADALEAAAEFAEQSQNDLQAGQMQAAQEAAEKSKRQLESASKAQSRDANAQQTTEQLASREQELTEQIGQLAQKSPEASSAAREQLQQQLNDEAADLSELLRRLASEAEAEPLSDRHQAGKLNELGNESDHANDSMRQALTEALRQNLSKATEQSANAQEKLQQLADKASDIASGKRDTLVPEPVGQEAADASRTLQQASESLQQAREAMEQQQNQQASGLPASDTPQNGPQANAESGQPSGQPQPGQPQSSQQSPDNSASAQNPANGTPAGPQQTGDNRQPSSPLDQLAQELAQAASALEQAHQHMQPQQQQGSSMSQQQQASNDPSQSSESESKASGNNMGQTPMDGSLSGEALRSALMRDWGQKQGPLEADLSDARRRPIDQEYAPFIQRYFESLSAPEPSAQPGTNGGQE